MGRGLGEERYGGPLALLCSVASRVEEGWWCYTRQEEPGGDGGEWGEEVNFTMKAKSVSFVCHMNLNLICFWDYETVA